VYLPKLQKDTTLHSQRANARRAVAAEFILCHTSRVLSIVAL